MAIVPVSYNTITSSTTGAGSFYLNAFYNELFTIWESTPFADELQDLAYYRAHSVFLRNSAVGEELRRKLLFTYMRNYFGDTNIDNTIVKHYSHLATNNLYVLRALNNLAILYNEPPVRIIESSKKDTIQELIDNSFYNVALQDCYKVAKLCNEAAIFPYFNRGKLKFRVLTPDMYRVKYDVYGNIEEFWTPHFDIDRLTSSNSYIFGNVETPDILFKVITKNQIYIVDDKGQKVSTDYFGKEIIEYNHNLGFAPIEILRLSYSEDTYGYSANQGLWELIRAQIEANMVDVLTESEVNLQGFSMFVFINMGLQREMTTELGSGKIIAVDQQHEDLQPPGFIKVEGSDTYVTLQQYKTDKLIEVMRNLGLPASLIENNPGIAASGVAMQVDRKELEENRRRDIPYCKMFEEDFLNVLIQFANQDIASPYRGKLNNVKFDLNIDYVEQSIFIDPQEELEYYNNLLDKGLITIKDYTDRLAQVDTITNDAEAISYIQENLNNKKLLYGGQDATSEAATADPNGDTRPINFRETEERTERIRESNINDTSEG